MGRNINTDVWTVDGSGYTQTVHDLFTGAEPVYTHAEHIDNSFNFCVNGVSEQNTRMCLHMTDRAENEYTIDSVPNIFIGDKFYDNRGAYSDRVNNILIANYGGVSNFAIAPDSGSQPASDFKIQPSFDYRTALWYPRIGFAEYNRSGVSYTYYTLNDLDGASTAADANPDETWWEYYTRKSSNYVMSLDAYNDSAYYSGGAFQSNTVVEGQTRFGFVPAWITWLSSPYYWGYSYGAKDCYYYYDNGQGRYSDLTFDVILPLSAEAMTKIDEYDDTWRDSYSNPYPRHVIVYTPKIDKNLVLRLICSYGLPFSFSSSTTDREFADADYALPVILNNTTTGEYVRGSDCITADTENNRWVNTADIDNKSPGGGGGGGSDEDEDTAISTAGAPYAKGLVNYYAMTAGSPLIDHISEALSTWDLQNTGKDLYKNLVSCKLIKPPAAIPTTGSEPFTIYGEKPQYQGADITLPVVSGNPDATFGPYSISRKFNDFRDYAPYTRVSIYLPYCGWCDLPSHVVGRSVTVKYFTDIIAATVRAVVFCGNNIIAEAAGVMGLDIPFTADAVGMKQAGVVSGLTAYAGGALQTAAGVASIIATKGGKGIGETLSGASKLVSAYTQTAIAFNENTTEISGKNGDGCCLSGATSIIIKIIRPKYGASSEPPFVPAGFAHSVGFVSNKQVRVGNVSGLLIADNVDTSGIAGATDAERAEIKRVLESGLIVNAAPE